MIYLLLSFMIACVPLALIILLYWLLNKFDSIVVLITVSVITYLIGATYIVYSALMLWQ